MLSTRFPFVDNYCLFWLWKWQETVEEVLDCGEETYYPALHVGSERSCAVVCIISPLLSFLSSVWRLNLQLEYGIAVTKLWLACFRLNAFTKMDIEDMLPCWSYTSFVSRKLQFCYLQCTCHGHQDIAPPLHLPSQHTKQPLISRWATCAHLGRHSIVRKRKLRHRIVLKKEN